MIRFTSLVVILLSFFCFGLAENPAKPGNDASQRYNFVKMVGDAGSNMAAAQHFRRFGNTSDIIDFLERLEKILDLIWPNGTLNPILVNFEEEMKNNSCIQDIFYTMRSARAKEIWAIQIIDAFGKPSAGVLDGNFKWLGDYHECRNVRAPPKPNTDYKGFQAQYCTVPATVSVMNHMMPLTLGICIPDSCVINGVPAILNDDDFLTLLANLTDDLGYLDRNKSSISISPGTCHATSRELSTPAIAMICVISFFALLAFIGSSITAYRYATKDVSIASVSYADSKSSQINGDVESHLNHGSMSSITFARIGEEENNGWMKSCEEFFNCFCFFTNGAKLLNTDSTEGQLLCLHGIRFLSMSWVMVCHTYAFSFASLGNIIETMGILDTWLFQVILNGFFSVDSFFLLSGFLVGYLYFKESAKTDGKVPWAYFYIHRFIRLTPPYMIVVGFFTALFYYMSSGPLWTTHVIDPMCQKSWWWNILYINNFQGAADMCMGWSWYLANDMQFFVISPLFLITLWKWPKIGYSMIGLFMCICFGSSFGLTYHYNLFAGLGNISSLSNDMMAFLIKWADFFDKLYIKPYARISPYLIGIALAYYMFKRKQNNQGKVSWVVLVCGWIIAAATTLTCLFVLYNRTLTVVEASFYNATNHAVFAFGLGWVIFTCLIGQGGPINSILSFKLFLPLSRLTYMAYLIHPIIQTIYFNGSKVPIQFSHLTLVISFFGILLITYAFAFVVSLLFESPIIRLEKFLRTKLRS